MKSLVESINESIMISESTHAYIGMYVSGDIEGEELSCNISDGNGKKIGKIIKDDKYICAYVHYDGYNVLEFIKKHLVKLTHEELLEKVFDKGQIRMVDLETGDIEHFPSRDNWGISMVDTYDELEPSAYTYFLDADDKWYQFKNGKKILI